MLKSGDTAPPFFLPDSDLRMVQLADFLGDKRVILYFYPRDDTPGCTLEALEFTDLEEEFTARGAVVLGVSRDNCVSHGAFRDKHGISVRLLADIEGDTCMAYGVWQERQAHGEKKMGILRSTFIIDPAGRIQHALYDVKPKAHAEAILELLDAT